jgi:ribosomal protein L40E
MFKIVRNQRDSVQDCLRMPKDLVESVALFMMTGQLELAERCRSCVDKVLLVYSDGPSVHRTISVGTASLCWRCGYAGLPKNVDSIGQQLEEVSTINFNCICAHCGETEDTNPIRVMQPDGTVLPWLQAGEAIDESQN